MTTPAAGLIFAPSKGRLIKVGQKLAVLGVDIVDSTGPWHITRPGTFNTPLLDDLGKTVGKALCGRRVLTNGYAADFVPGDLCPGCREQL
jgi:hypothetical protein